MSNSSDGLSSLGNPAIHISLLDLLLKMSSASTTSQFPLNCGLKMYLGNVVSSAVHN